MKNYHHTEYLVGVLRSANTDDYQHKIIVFGIEDGNVVDQLDYPSETENLVYQHQLIYQMTGTEGDTTSI